MARNPAIISGVSIRDWETATKVTFAGVVIAALALVVTIVVGTHLFGIGAASPPSVTVINNAVAPFAPIGPDGATASCPDQSGPKSGSSELTIDVSVRQLQPGACFETAIDAGLTPGTVQLRAQYVNTSKTDQRNVEFRVRLARGLAPVPDSTYLVNDAHPRGWLVPSNALTGDGIVLGNYGPGANAYVYFEAKTPFAPELRCGTSTLRSIVFVQPKGLNYFYNTVNIRLSRRC